jgi:2-dehydropantoate 2-reductase
MSQSILIIGSGALACFFAARIGRSGVQVFLTDSWTEGLEALRENGVRLVEESRITTQKITVLEKPDSINKFAAALILTKAYQTSQAVQSAYEFLAKDGTVLTLQNGLTARGKIVEILGEERVLSGITTCAAQMLEPGVVKYNGGNTVRLGSHLFAKNYREIFMSAGFDVTVESKINEMIWEKALLNAAINPLGALLGKTNGELRNDPEVNVLMKTLLAEGCRTARSDGIEMDEEYLEKRLITVLEETASNQCSMLQDILNGRQTEIDDINGALVEIAARNEIQIPVQVTLIRLVKAMQRKVHT